MNRFEIWVPIFLWEGIYEISSHGRVRSMRTGNCLRPAMIKGYWYVMLQYRPGKPGARKRGAQVHRLMLESFTRRKPAKLHSCHINGEPLDNRIENLYWATREQNMADKYRHGTMPHGESSVKAKLKAPDVLIIMARLKKGERVPDIAKDYPFVTSTAIYDIRAGKSWKHLRPKGESE